jgi:Icc-related predicted phosphoesterase
MKNITLISDTHSKQGLLTNDLIGGDIIIHGGDIMTSGYHKTEIKYFLDWFDKLNYNHKIFIAGNHDRFIENHPDEFRELLLDYPDITYLQDDFVVIDDIKIYGTPWQPEFYNWAFNLKRDGIDIIEKWNLIPEDTDILITHGPPNGILDYVAQSTFHAGCNMLRKRVFEVKPKLNIFGHIHQGYGLTTQNDIDFINASVLNEEYRYANKPIDLVFDKDKGVLNFL